MARHFPSWFSSIDTDGDGFIDPSEFDGSSQLTEDVINWVHTLYHKRAESA